MCFTEKNFCVAIYLSIKLLIPRHGLFNDAVARGGNVLQLHLCRKEMAVAYFKRGTEENYEISHPTHAQPAQLE